MNNKYTDIIKDKMKDFIQYQFSEEEIKNNNLISCLCPVEPDLMGYVFNKILNFEVKYRPFEKINYQISFKYKGSLGCISHFKLSYTLYLEEKIKDEVLEILVEVNELLEKALIEYSEEAVKKNLYSLPNFYDEYLKKINIIEQNIERIKNKIIRKKELKKRDIQRLKNTGEADNIIEVDLGDGIKSLRFPTYEVEKKYDKKIIILEKELSYTIELYIDNFYSLLEHFLVLLFPMTEKYDENKEFSIYLKCDWRSKIEKLSNNYKDELNKLSMIKEIYRNRFAHGFFSKEKEIHVYIPTLGNYPLWIGKRYCKGYYGTTNELTYEIYLESKKSFESFMKKIKENYKLQFNIIESGIPTFLKKNIYGEALENEKENAEWIERYWYEQCNRINMDW